MAKLTAIPVVPILHHIKKSIKKHQRLEPLVYGGKVGIRTPAGVTPTNGLANHPL